MSDIRLIVNINIGSGNPNKKQPTVPPLPVTSPQAAVLGSTISKLQAGPEDAVNSPSGACLNSCIRLSHEEAIGFSLPFPPPTGSEGLSPRSNVPEDMRLTKTLRGWVCEWRQREGANHKHGGDPNNTDNLVDTAEAIVPLPHPPTPDTNTTHPPLLPPRTQNDHHCFETAVPQH